MNQSRQLSQTPAKFLMTMSIIFFAMLAAQILFALVVSYLNSNRDMEAQASDRPFLYVVPIMAVVCFILSKVMFDQILKQAKLKEALNEKAMVYQAAFLTRLALLEGASLFGIVTYFLTGNIFLLSVSALVILYFLTLRPTKERVSSNLALDYHQQKQFDNADEIMQ
ncbi:hypothetical protein ACFSJU_03745 [Paradesertivirga mongoliensis]|uniref:DUF2975 domain-containing protein n=1 Tax=Paradesertivirga mongoliensis TaxID=2100740 RepID=A0ABW4ZHJ0_9SPHI|nr:hypothetical protein [Pedobacter mongoliensis]